MQKSIHTYACFCRLVDTDGLIIHFNYIAFNIFPFVTDLSISIEFTDYCDGFRVMVGKMGANAMLY